MNKEIAARLNLSEATVKYHIGQVLKLWQVASRQEAVGKAEQLERFRKDSASGS